MQRRYWRNRVYGGGRHLSGRPRSMPNKLLALFICSYIFQGLALVDSRPAEVEGYGLHRNS